MAELPGDDGDDLDCTKVVEELYAYLDDEMAESLRHKIDDHFGGCVPCHEAAAFEALLKRTISEKCRDAVPDALRLRIEDALTTIRLGE